MGFKNKSEGKKEGRKQKGQKAAEQNERIRKYKKEQQVKKRGKKSNTD